MFYGYEPLHKTPENVTECERRRSCRRVDGTSGVRNVDVVERTSRALMIRNRPGRHIVDYFFFVSTTKPSINSMNRNGSLRGTETVRNPPTYRVSSLMQLVLAASKRWRRLHLLSPSATNKNRLTSRFNYGKVRKVRNSNKRDNKLGCSLIGNPQTAFDAFPISSKSIKKNRQWNGA